MVNKGIIGKHSNNGVSEDLTSDWLKREKRSNSLGSCWWGECGTFCTHQKLPKKISPHSLTQMAKFQEITNGS